jgi:hypothetical protein
MFTENVVTKYQLRVALKMSWEMLCLDLCPRHATDDNNAYSGLRMMYIVTMS